MPLNEFWYGDMRLFDCYQKAYLADKSYSAWYNGAYVFEAVSKAIHNGFGRKKGEKGQDYDQWKNPLAKLHKRKLSKEELEIEFRESQYQQNCWLFRK